MGKAFITLSCSVLLYFFVKNQSGPEPPRPNPGPFSSGSFTGSICGQYLPCTAWSYLYHSSSDRPIQSGTSPNQVLIPWNCLTLVCAAAPAHQFCLGSLVRENHRCHQQRPQRPVDNRGTGKSFKLGCLSSYWQ